MRHERYFKPTHQVHRNPIAGTSLGASRCDYDHFSRQPLTYIRQSLLRALREGREPRSLSYLWENLTLFWEELRNIAPELAPQLTEIASIRTENLPKYRIDLSSPVLQLAWAIRLLETSRGKTPTEAVRDPYFLAVAHAEEARREISRLARDILFDPLIDPSYTLGWGAAGSWYWCDAELRHINLDLFCSLTLGLEYSRAIALHEIAHASLTQEYTPEMRALIHRQRDIIARAEQTPMSAEEEAELHRVEMEFHKRRMLFDAAEDVRVNSHVKRLSTLLTQDYSHALNAVFTSMGRIQDQEQSQRQLPDPLTHVSRALTHIFYAQNGLLEDSREGYRRFGVEPLSIPPPVDEPGTNGFESLKRSVLGPQGLTELLPSLSLRYLQPLYAEESERRASQAADLIDSLWHRFRLFDSPRMPKSRRAEGTPEGGGRSAKTDTARKPEGEQHTKQEKDTNQEQSQTSPSPLPQTPEEARQSQRAGYAQKPYDAKRIEDAAEEDQPEQQGPAASRVLTLTETRLTGPTGRGYGTSFNELQPLVRHGNLSAYFNIVEAQLGLINRLKKILVDIQDKTKITTVELGTTRQVAPEDGDLFRLDLDSVVARRIKAVSGARMTLADYEHYRSDDRTKSDIPPTDVAIVIDGSGSMSGWPTETAVQMSTALFEAAKAANIRVYVVIMGDRQPVLVAQPGDGRAQIGEQLEAVRAQCAGDCDYLAPAIELVLERIGHARDMGVGYAGNTHILVLSDGMFTDEAYAIPKLRKLMRASAHLTIDILLIGDRAVRISTLVDEINDAIPSRPMGCARVASQVEAETKLLEILTQRLRHTPLDQAVSLRQKQYLFQTLLRKMRR